MLAYIEFILIITIVRQIILDSNYDNEEAWGLPYGIWLISIEIIFISSNGWRWPCGPFHPTLSLPSSTSWSPLSHAVCEHCVFHPAHPDHHYLMRCVNTVSSIQHSLITIISCGVWTLSLPSSTSWSPLSHAVCEHCLVHPVHPDHH